MITKAHQSWIDDAKGIGVLLVIIGHLLYSSTLNSLNQAIYSFHTPLFFVLSGYVDHRNSNRIDYFKRKFRRLIIPYFIFVVLSSQVIFSRYLHDDTIEVILQDIFYYNGRIAFNEPLWFLAVIFQVYLISGFVDWESIKKHEYCCILLGLCLVNYFLYSATAVRFGGGFNRFGFNRTTIALFFFIFGKTVSKYWGTTRKIDILAASIALLIWYYSAMIANQKVSFYGYSFPSSLWWFLVSGTMGSLVVILIFRKLIQRKCIILSNIGRHSIIYLGTQDLWIVPFTEYVKESGWDKTNRYIIAMLLMTIMYVLIVEIGILVFERVKEKYEGRKTC